MAKNPYVFITCLATGAPWCEQSEGTAFAYFMHTTFGSSIVGGVPSQVQDMEFSCAHPTRNGSNSMLKGPSACFVPDVLETPRVVFTVRGLWLPDGEADIIRSPVPGRSATKFWIAIRASEEIIIPFRLANDRWSPYRRRPSEMSFLPPRLVEQIQQAVLESVKAAHALIIHNREHGPKRRKRDGTTELHCIKKLVDQLGVSEVFPIERPSTAWKATADTVFAPVDIILRNCSCARLEPFAEHMFVDCKGLGTSNVARKTRFDTETEVTAALLHAEKCKLLCLLRGEPISSEDVLRLKVHADNLGFATLVCRLETCIESSERWGNEHRNVFASDKHRMLWMINTRELSDIGNDGNVHRASSRDVRMIKSSLCRDKLEEAYQRGTLHVIKAAGLKRDYSTHLTLEPPLTEGGEYLGVVLGWVGNRVYQHSAIIRSACAHNTLGLGVLRSAFYITEPWQGPSVDCVNVLKGQVDPSSPFMQTILHQRSIELTEDQIRCMQQIDRSNNPHLKIQALAGTGKSLVLALLVEAALTVDCPRNGAVVIVTPSRNLRDSILKRADLFGHVFTEDDLGPRVLWLGRQADSPGSICCWEDRMVDLINERLRPELEQLQHLEMTELRPAFHNIKTLGIEWAGLPSGDALVIEDEAFAALEEFRALAFEYMLQIFHIKSRKTEQMESIIDEPRQGHLIVSTMDAFVKWRAGEIKGYMNRFLQSLQVTLVCMEMFESFDVPQVVAALSNVQAKTLLMVGDVHQRIENCRLRRRRINFSGKGKLDALQFVHYGLEDDGEQYESRTMGVAQSNPAINKGSMTVPGARPWHEWSRSAEHCVLDLCKRCGKEVCDYIRHCFHFAQTFTSDSAVAFNTKLEHVFFDGEQWHGSPWLHGEEVGWHSLMFESLCQAVLADLLKYERRHPNIQKLPTPTVLVIMPLSRSAIPLCMLMQAALEANRIPPGVVQVSLPLNTKGESVPIVHCVRHRRSLRASDQYAGTQQNLHQEYINLTRGVEKTCMWVETQPFGHPRKPCDARHYFPDGGSCDEHCSVYAKRRNEHIWDNNLPYSLLREPRDIRNMASNLYECFHEEIAESYAYNIHNLTNEIWWKLNKKEFQDIPHLGPSSSDFSSFEDVLYKTTDRNTCVSRFAYETTQSLRALGHSSATTRWKRSDRYEKANRTVDVFDWKPALQFAHLFLPCATAEISSQADKGVTRLCFPFIQASDAVDPEDAIASLCALTWFLAFILEKNLVTTARLCRVSHKMCITEENGDLWFNKPSKTGRIATAIKEESNSILYMYMGGGAVDHEQSYLLGGLVVSCKSWQWAALVYAAARVAGLASNNSLGSLSSFLMIPMDGEESVFTTTTHLDFQQCCYSMWERVCAICNDMLYDLEKERRTDTGARSAQSKGIGVQLDSLRKAHAAEVSSLLG